MYHHLLIILNIRAHHRSVPWSKGTLNKALMLPSVRPDLLLHQNQLITTYFHIFHKYFQHLFSGLLGECLFFCFYHWKIMAILAKISSFFMVFFLGGVGFPRWPSGKESASQCSRCRRLGFNPWVRKTLWSRKWQPTPIFLPGKFHGQRKLVGYSP